MDAKNYIKTHRADFADKRIKLTGDNPYKMFENWLEEAIESKVLNPYAFSLATNGVDGFPSLRVLFLRGMKENGLIFYTNYNSLKGIEIEKDSKVVMNFFWDELDRQVRIKGVVKKLPEQESDDYFASRPRASQIGAWSSLQSSEMESYATVEQRVKEFEKKFKDQEVPRPKHWGGYVVTPVYFEFWQGRPSRLHERVIFELIEKDWDIKRLYP